MKFLYGNSDFEELRPGGYFYVDKTRYIETLESLPDKHILILRSRRFGKTLFVNMLGWYYDQRHVDRFEAIFEGTYIYDHPTPKRASYMMLTFNFSGINTETLENANKGFLASIRDSVDVFLGLYSSHFSKEECQHILRQTTPNDILTALFGKIKKKEMGKCTYVLIDEYDHFANNILSQGKEMFKDLVRTDGYVRPFYEALKKGTEHAVDRIFITGVLPILLDSLTSGFNIAKNKSTDKLFNEMFGFTEEEILPVLDALDNRECLDEIRAYYNGYRFHPRAENRLYNSDMILYYATEYDPELRRPESMIDPNVISDYRKVRAILSIGNRTLEEDILTSIVQDGTVSVNEIAQLFILTQETEFLFDAKMLITLLFYMGYLTIAHATPLKIDLAMPNLVLKSLYLDYMQYVLMKRAHIRIDGLERDEMIRDLAEGKIDLLLELTERLLKGLSNRDYERFDEKYIKVLMLSLVSEIKFYIPHSEYEVNADGYVDLYFQPAIEPETFVHYFIELKYIKTKATKAVQQKAEREGIAAMKTYLKSHVASSIQHLHGYVLVFRKDRCVRRVKI